MRTIDRTLVVVLDDQGVLPRRMARHALGDVHRRRPGQGLLEIHAHDLLAHAHQALFQCRTPTVDDHQIGFHAGSIERPGHCGTVPVVPDRAHQGAAGPERDDVQGDIGRATETVFRSIDQHDGDRRFVGNAFRPTMEIAIEH